MGSSQPDLFGQEARLPAGFEYRPEFITQRDERDLVERLQDLSFAEFEFHGFLGKRRVVLFGWRYDFNEGGLKRAEDIPTFLLPVRARAAAFAGVQICDLQQVLLTEYRPGAAIGWHRDKSVFGEVVGISLLSPCQFRLRRRVGARWERISVTAEPRSVYLLQGPSRTEWEHSIPAVNALRYSITFRRLLRPCGRVVKRRAQ
jgi:alkylated DNA repair dioxygenase AlkB